MSSSFTYFTFGGLVLIFQLACVISNDLFLSDLSFDLSANPRNKAEMSAFQKITMYTTYILNHSDGSDLENDDCHPELERLLDIALTLMNDKAEEWEVLGAFTALIEKLKILQNPDLYFCNRTRLMTCNDVTKKCECAPNTGHRLIRKYDTKSYFCYMLSGPCDADVTKTMPLFDDQQKRMMGHYGHPNGDLYGRFLCLMNLCVIVNTDKRQCEGYNERNYSPRKENFLEGENDDRTVDENNWYDDDDDDTLPLE